MKFKISYFLVLLSYVIIFIIGCEKTQLLVEVPQASSEVLQIREYNTTHLDNKYSSMNSNEFQLAENETKPEFADTYPENSIENQNSGNEERLALVIGNSAYDYGGKLKNPVNDARSMTEALNRLGFDVMTYENSDQNGMKKAIDTFGKELSKYDVGLFFYAGHGIQVKGNNYLIPVDARLDSENDAEYNCVDANRVLAKMEDAGNKTNIIILDACRDNPFERSWKRSVKGSGLAFMNAPTGSVIAYATAPGGTAIDIEKGQGQNGAYTAALLRHMNTPNINILEMFQKVRTTVLADTDKKQIPWESTSLTGPFYFICSKN